MKKVLVLLAVCSFLSCTKEKEETTETTINSEVREADIPPPPQDADGKLGDLPPEPMKEGEEIFTAAEIAPSFPGGESAMRNFLSENLIYPETASKAKVAGRVTVQFVVEKDGGISSPKVLKGIGFGCDEEAVRVIKSMPKWTPALQNGQNVRAYFNLPITFTLKD